MSGHRSIESRSADGIRAREQRGEGEVVRVGKKRLSVRVLDDPQKHQYWRDEHVGTIKVISPSRAIPELGEGQDHV